MTCVTNVARGMLHDDAVEMTTTNSNSQDSSSAKANASQPLPKSASSIGLLEPLEPGVGRDATTPSTSLSDYSSEENVLSDQRNADRSQIIRQEREIASTSPTLAFNAATEVSQTAYTGGLKRTATGQLKSPVQGNLPTSPMGSSFYGHSRNTSMASRSSHIGEISKKLQARLSYARVKVQHGWENRRLGELERMAANQDLVTGVPFHTMRGYDTPSTSYSPVDKSVTAQDQGRASTRTPPEYTYSPLPEKGIPRGSGKVSQRLTASGTTSMPTTRPNETYEQFWQSHSNSTIPQTRGPNLSSLNVPSLAPPVEFSPRTAAATRGKPQSLHSNPQFPGYLPSTPPSRGTFLAKIRTPSQQAAVEQDALEGLMSMNSPAHSQNQPSTSSAPVRNPLQGQIFRPRSVVDGIIPSPSLSSGPMRNFQGAKELSDDEINKMLDEMPEMSSSDEDDLMERRIAPSVVES